jgi:tetratricopeptide (TPR) repeat protein
VHSLDALLDRLRDGHAARLPAFDPATARLAVIVTGNPDEDLTAAAAIAGHWRDAFPSTTIVDGPIARRWPFVEPPVPADAPAIVWMPGVHEAFVNHQTAGTRLVTTQAPFQVLAWRHAVGERPVLLLSTAARASLEEHAPEVLTRRGPFAEALLHVGDRTDASGTQSSSDRLDADDGAAATPADTFARAFRVAEPAERLALCVKALDGHRTPAALVAAASACMEVNDFDAAARDLEEALTIDPDRAAAHFERGKLWLRRDDMEQAGASFREAAERLPAFVSAWANLGATLGELDRPGQALAAFERALAGDPANPQTVNNIGVVNRELGNLAASEAAFRQVTTLAPDLAFGFYNLGHTLFLQGRYQAALSAYVEGQQRDADRNPVQATRLAMSRLATGDPRGALNDLRRSVANLPREYKRQLLADTHSILWALLTHRPDLAGWSDVNEWLSAEMRKLA